MDVRFRAPEADGLRIRNEVDFVAALRQFQAEFGGDDTAAAIRRITGDSNFHVGSSPSRGLFIRWLGPAMVADFTRERSRTGLSPALQVVLWTDCTLRVELVQMGLKPVF